MRLTSLTVDGITLGDITNTFIERNLSGNGSLINANYTDSLI